MKLAERIVISNSDYGKIRKLIYIYIFLLLFISKQQLYEARDNLCLPKSLVQYPVSFLFGRTSRLQTHLYNFFSSNILSKTSTCLEHELCKAIFSTSELIIQCGSYLIFSWVLSCLPHWPKYEYLFFTLCIERYNPGVRDETLGRFFFFSQRKIKFFFLCF